MLQALKLLTGLQTAVSVQLTVDGCGAAAKPVQDWRADIAFVRVAQCATTRVRGTVTLTVHTKRGVGVAGLVVRWETSVRERKRAAAEATCLPRVVASEEVVLCAESRVLETGSHTYEFAIPVAGHWPNTARAWKADQGLDITHTLHATCTYTCPRRGTLSTCEVVRELMMYRHLDEERKAEMEGAVGYRDVVRTVDAHPTLPPWRLRTVIPTHIALGSPIPISFLATTVAHTAAPPDLLSCRLIEQLEYADGTRAARAVGPTIGFSPSRTQRVDVDDEGRVVNVKAGGAEEEAGGGGERYRVAELPTVHAQPRTTNDWVSVTHFVECRVAPGFGGVFAGPTTTMVPIRVVYVPKTSHDAPGCVRSSLRSSGAGTATPYRYHDLQRRSSFAPAAPGPRGVSSYSSLSSSTTTEYDPPPSFQDSIADIGYEAIPHLIPHLAHDIALEPGDTLAMAYTAQRYCDFPPSAEPTSPQVSVAAEPPSPSSSSSSSSTLPLLRSSSPPQYSPSAIYHPRGPHATLPAIPPLPGNGDSPPSYSSGETDI
ncbi:hypothetical protein DFJ77DRAFT_475115 [Powellomyces hirtus]|nr:hypothetical protein DFJ77DRAFT_475115 [Powellomyces hirtus]